MKKAAEIIRFQRLVGCGERTRTSDLRVMSCGSDGLSAPLRAFAPFLLGIKIRFVPVCSVDSAQSEPRMGHGLGLTARYRFRLKILYHWKKPCPVAIFLCREGTSSGVATQIKFWVSVQIILKSVSIYPVAAGIIVRRSSIHIQVTFCRYCSKADKLFSH